MPEGFVLPAARGTARRDRRRDPTPCGETYGTAYFDTADLRLARWGCSLRFREGEGWTVKLPPARRRGRSSSATSIASRARPGRPPAAAVDLVRAFVRDRPARSRGAAAHGAARVELADAGRRATSARSSTTR